MTLALAARAKSFFSTAVVDGLARRRHPQAAARQFGRDIGHDLAIRRGDKADQTMLSGMISPDDDAAAFARRIALPVVLIHVVRRSGHQASVVLLGFGVSSAGASSTGSSIQPILTRAFMMMALASSAVRLKPSSAPGTRTRSLSLLVS